ncbi:hypothetical protein CI610_00152 [invertebrate metagenome]|uniref:Transposase IS30-like HTH domain-containing protein n=1 Tax=invertebrate metagenome TaxID=1711999 RepID=A0A2H9TC99_9ZZZZ
MLSHSEMEVWNEHSNQTLQTADSRQTLPAQALLQNDFSQTAIAVTLGVSKSTVSRELKRNSDPSSYCTESAEKRKTERKINAGKTKKANTQHRNIIEKSLLLGWSPENISSRMKIEIPEKAISHTPTYRMIEEDRVAGGHLHECCHALVKPAGREASVKRAGH